MRIHTVGHSTHSLEDFLGLLRRHDVGVLVDVRRHPGSRRMPWFAAESLAEAWPAYLHVPELGGRRTRRPDSPNGGWQNASFQGYADHMASAEFRRGLDRLLAQERPAVMCAEAQWWRCHRRLIADALVAMGHEVVHVFPDGRADVHELTAFAVVADGEMPTYPPAQLSL